MQEFVKLIDGRCLLHEGINLCWSSKRMHLHQQNVRVLYKTILRLHRALPQEVRELGDQYVKDEFRRHKNVGKEHVAPFMMEWAVSSWFDKLIWLSGTHLTIKTASHQTTCRVTSREANITYVVRYCFQNYCGLLAEQLGLRGPKSASTRLGITLEEAQLEHFEDQQVYQLYELKKSINPTFGDSVTSNSESSTSKTKLYDKPKT